MKKQLNITGILSLLSAIGYSQFWWFISGFYEEKWEGRIPFIVAGWVLLLFTTWLIPALVYIGNAILFLDENRE